VLTIVESTAVGLGPWTLYLLQCLETDDPQWPYAVVLVDPHTTTEIWRLRFATCDAAMAEWTRRVGDYA